MKRFLILMSPACAACLLCGCLAGAPVSGGYKVGLNVAQFVSDDISAGIASRPGFVGGLFRTTSTGGGLALGFELLLSMKGATDPSSDYEAALYYVEMPVLLRTSVRGPAVYVGLAAGYLLYAAEGFGYLQDITEYVEPLELSFVAGFQLSSGSFLFDVRRTGGLTDIIKEEGRSATNRAYSVMIGMAF